MGEQTTDGSYRLELMRLRQCVASIRRMYRGVAVISALLALFSLFNSTNPYQELAVAVGVLGSISSVLAYRGLLKGRGVWALITLALWVGPAGASLLAASARYLHRVSLGELEWTHVFTEGGFGWFTIYIWVVGARGLWAGLLRPEEVALIEEHREEWDSYEGGRSFRSKASESATAENPGSLRAQS